MNEGGRDCVVVGVAVDCPLGSVRTYDVVWVEYMARPLDFQWHISLELRFN